MIFWEAGIPRNDFCPFQTFSVSESPKDFIMLIVYVMQIYLSRRYIIIVYYADEDEYEYY